MLSPARMPLSLRHRPCAAHQQVAQAAFSRASAFQRLCQYYRLTQKARRRRLLPTAALFDPQPAVDGLSGLRLIVQAGALSAYAVSILYSLSGAAEDSLQSGRRKPQDPDDEDSVGVKWGTMGVISLLPLFNWLAWIFAAQEDSDKARQYYTFAALYALPLLTNGFNQDAFSIAAVLACAAHVQVERIVQTEPELITKGSLVSNIAQAAKQLTASFEANPSKTLGKGDARPEVPGKNTDRSELDEWDARLKRRDKESK